jgi:hypothetical protein
MTCPDGKLRPDDGTSRPRGDLQVEDRLPGALDRQTHPLVGGGVGEVTLHVGQPRGQAIEDLRVDDLAGALDRLPGVLVEVVVGPLVDRHPRDRTRQQAAPLEAVRRSEGHHLWPDRR